MNGNCIYMCTVYLENTTFTGIIFHKCVLSLFFLISMNFSLNHIMLLQISIAAVTFNSVV